MTTDRDDMADRYRRPSRSAKASTYIPGAGALALLLVGGRAAMAQQPATVPAALVFDGVTVVDVTQGRLLAGQRVVVAGNRIRAVGDARAIPVPDRAQVIEARGKFLIPDLWDLHTHANRATDLAYPLFLANGITGIRDAGSVVPLDTLHLWRREILAGARIGPPRQLLSGQSINEEPGCRRYVNGDAWSCVTDSADARHLVDSLKAAGADLLKPRAVSRGIYFVLAAEARRVGLPFGGHTEAETALEAADSGARFLDHVDTGGDIDGRCLWDENSVPMSLQMFTGALGAIGHPQLERTYGANVDQCRPVAERFQHTNTWWVPTLVRTGPGLQLGLCSEPILQRLRERESMAWTYRGNWLHGAAAAACQDSVAGILHLAQQVGLPILAGTDASTSGEATFTRGPYVGLVLRPGFTLHAELAMYVAEGLTPLAALQTATLNPARMWQATDSLGTIATGKLADMVLLDGNPLADITNTTAIRAVVANGRYFDRAALDSLMAQAQAQAKVEQP